MEPSDIRGIILPGTVDLRVEKHIENISLQIRKLGAFVAFGAPSVCQRLDLDDNRWHHSDSLLQTIRLNV